SLTMRRGLRLRSRIAASLLLIHAVRRAGAVSGLPLAPALFRLPLADQGSGPMLCLLQPHRSLYRRVSEIYVRLVDLIEPIQCTRDEPEPLGQHRHLPPRLVSLAGEGLHHLL